MLRTHYLSLICLLLLAACEESFEIISGRISSPATPDTCSTTSEDGTTTNPFKIETIADFPSLEGSSQSFILCNDLDLSSMSAPLNAFSGHLNGNNKTLRNLTLDITGDILANEKVGLFKSISGAKIENLVLDNFNIRSVRFMIGALAGEAVNSELSKIKVTNSTIRWTSGTAAAGSSDVAALIGVISSSSLKYIRSLNNMIVGRDNASGVVGRCAGPLGTDYDIEDVLVTGTVRGSSWNTAGIIGRSWGCSVNLATNKATILKTGFGNGAGIVAASGAGTTTVRNAINLGSIESTGTAWAGCLGGIYGDTGGIATIENTLSLAMVDVPGDPAKGYILGCSGAAGTIVRDSYHVNSNLDTTADYMYSGQFANVTLDSTDPLIPTDGVARSALNLQSRTSLPAGTDFQDTSIWIFTPGQVPALNHLEF